MFDILVLLVIGLSTAFAAMRGGLRELSTLIALAVAGGLTFILIEPLLSVIGMTGSFFGTVIVAVILITVFFIATHIGLHLGLKKAPLHGLAKFADRAIGGGFGIFRGLVLVGLGYLGYSYYLDEPRQPDSVKNAITQPVAAGMAHWFQSFTPDDAEIENAAPIERDIQEDGYNRSDRNSLTEIVSTVTTTDASIPDQTEPDQTEAPNPDDIADLIIQEDNQ